MGVEQIRFRGTVQGVGFRPAVARLARAHGLRGWVRNDAEGVLVALSGDAGQRQAFLDSLLEALPPLAHVQAVERRPAPELDLAERFDIVPSAQGEARTAISPDAATCEACAQEVRDPFARRFRYPFTNCTHCGPRFSIVLGIPYDRAATTMAGFPLCEDCRAEYEDEADRRYHAQPVACFACGPQATLTRADGLPSSFATYSMLDEVDAARTLLMRGQIVAIKGLGGYHLCCDATQPEAVERLRARKLRPDKPFALMARDVEVIRRYCAVSPAEEQALRSPAAPIVLLDMSGPEHVAPAVAPGQRTLGFMLPYTPLHLLVFRSLDRPIVCTSGNLSDAPQVIDDDEAQARLGEVADWFLRHDRNIANRVDDSVARVMASELRVLRRARGYAPAPLRLHPGFAKAPALTAMGGHLKSTFCLLQGDQALLSPHLGDLDELRTVQDYERGLARLSALFDHTPSQIVVDRHPEYRSHLLGEALAASRGLPLVEVAHHHAHAAACMAENGLGPAHPPVLALVLDGLGMGPEGQLWGCELLAADFRSAERLGGLPALALLGGDRAAQQPWRSLYAHLVEALGWGTLEEEHGTLEAVRALRARSGLMQQLLSRAPRASSSGRLFDAVAAALGLHLEAVSFEAQAAMALEAIVAPEAEGAYPISLEAGRSPAEALGPMWTALLADLASDTPAGVIAARFHEGLAQALARAASRARLDRPELDVVVLSGGTWQNRVLLERCLALLEADGWRALSHRLIPPNDGGLALGQAAIAAARAATE